MTLPLSQTQAVGQAKPRPFTPEDAAGILGLVNVGGEVLNTADLKKDPATLARIAMGIINLRKSGGPVQMENGRIQLSKEVFDSIVRSAESPNKGPEQVYARQNSPISPAPEGHRTFVSRPAQNNSCSAPDITPAQAWDRLKDLKNRDGRPYLNSTKAYDDSPEDRAQLSSALDDFWKARGHNISVNGKHTCFTIKPVMLVGPLLNVEVARKLSEVA
ncbi:MAG: hypothetical protein WC490_07845 [Candidatus Margulisiibacteriota bacterium]